MTFPFAQPVTLIRRVKSGTDTLGNDVYTETATEALGAFNPGTSAELVQGQDLVTVQPSVYLPAGTVVGSVDRIEVSGLSYEVDGTPNVWTNPFTGWSPGIEVKLRRVTG